ncbi:MAG TPA: TonB-dependent receptor [Bacteroidia bacterium]
MKKLVTSTLFVLWFVKMSLAQSPTQKIIGTVIDKQSQSPLIGVSIVVTNSNPLIGTTTDNEGHFMLKEVPIGRTGLVFTYLGYKTVTLSNIILNAGKEAVLSVSMEESINSLNEVTVSSGHDKKNPLNEMATVSSRSFSIDETNRYAGSLGDPSRMVTNFAGVGVAGDSRNDIVIRGNSPLGVLWRMDGINIPNPNHFGSLGTTGGPVSMLNNNVLDNSDFMTGAFPAGYGNALSGAFDLRMRNGNRDKREIIGQIGLNGFELGAEGPFSKNSKATFLANYRYSTLGVFHAIGVSFGFGSIPQYQDFNFKLDFPMGTKYGRISVFGIGGISYVALLAKDQKPGDFSVSPLGMDTYFGANTGIMGANYKYFFNEKTMQTIGMATSAVQNISKVDSLYNGYANKKNFYGQNSTEIKYSLTYNLNYKLNAKNTFNAGVMADMYHYNYADSILYKGKFYQKISNFKGDAGLLQEYVKWQHKFTEKLTLNSGIHSQQFLLNGSYSLEPRIGLKWSFSSKQTISAAMGMHSQIQPSYLYFYSTQLPDGSYIQTNKNLGFSKSNHYVLAYDNNFAQNWRLKVEGYYQQLYNIPVESTPSSFSALNMGASYINPTVDSLKNKGTGTNYGAEFTLEKFFSKHYYALVTASVFNSLYRGSDGVERSTAFNGNYILNSLAGAEFNLDKSKRSVLTFSTKINYAGGKHYTEINLDESKKEDKAVYYLNEAYAKQFPAYSRIDIKVGYKLNGKRITQEWAFDIQNIFNRKNVFQQIYDPVGKQIVTQYQLGFFPVATYRVTF